MNEALLEYPWLQKTWNSFVNLVSLQRLPQTFLISATTGLGKEKLIECMEKFLLCKDPKPHESCGKCRSCHLFQQGTHTDYRHLGIDESITIDEIRQINDFFNQTSHQAGRRIITLNHVDKLHVGAANALLKSLEEPPKDIIFLLTAEKIASVLPTIQSRAFKITLPIPSSEITIDWLRKRHPARNEVDLTWCLTLSGGSPLMADTLLKEQSLDKPLQLLCEILFFKKNELIYQKEMQQWISTQPYDILQLIYYLMVKLVYQIARQENDLLLRLLNSEKLKVIIQQISLEQVLIYFEKIQETLQEFSTPGVNKALLLESLFFMWQEILKTTD